MGLPRVLARAAAGALLMASPAWSMRWEASSRKSRPVSRASSAEPMMDSRTSWILWRALLF